MEPEGTGVSYLTVDGYKKLRAELDHLTKVKRSEIADRIRESKDHGEFAEDNSELDEVKMEQAIVESRISDLKAIFASAETIDDKDVPTDKVGFGSYVTVKNAQAGIEFEVRIVAAIEANPDEDLISDESPMGQALMGRSQGEKVTLAAPDGEIEYEIVKIRA